MARAGALLAMLALGRPFSPAFAAGPVMMPTSPVRLRRVLVRGLHDGKQIVVTRDWQCRFEAVESAWRVTGEQIGVEVEAPAPLAPLAEIERRREADGLFPMVLSREGRILSVAGNARGEAVDRAIDTAAAIFKAWPDQPGSVDDPDAFLSTMARTAAGQVSRVPRDLFFPTAGRTSDLRRIDIGDGNVGEVEVVVSVEVSPRGGLLRRSERRVETRLGGRARVTIERWEIVPV